MDFQCGLQKPIKCNIIEPISEFGDFMNELLKDIDKLKERVDALRPLKNGELKQLKQYFKVSLTFTSNALEGNSIDETETKIILEDGLTIGGKSLREHFEVIGHGAAYDHISALAKGDKITETDIKKIHYLFYRHIDEGNAGKYRKSRVYITGSEHIPPQPKDVPYFMKEFVARLPKLKAANHPVIYAALAHKEFVTIHPFVDGNGRVARLLMNLILLQAGYLIAIIPPVLRRQYINSLEKAQVAKNDTDYLKLICQCVKETQRDYIRMLE